MIDCREMAVDHLRYMDGNEMAITKYSNDARW